MRDLISATLNKSYLKVHSKSAEIWVQLDCSGIPSATTVLGKQWAPQGFFVVNE